MAAGGTLPYAEATELAKCIEIMGDESDEYCRQEVLGEEPPQKTVRLNISKLEGSTRSTSISAASKILEAAADVAIIPGAVETISKEESEALIGKNLVLKEYAAPGRPTTEERQLTTRNRTDGTITAYFVKSLSAGSHGEAFWPAGFPTIPSSVVLKNGDNPFVAGKPLAHELVHVLVNSGMHPGSQKNLMSYSNRGVRLSNSQMLKVRASQFVK